MSELAKFQMELSKSQAQFVNETRTSLTNQPAQLRNLEAQMGQMVTMFNERQRGILPSTSKVNPRRDGKEHCKSITLRSDKTIEKSVQANEEEKPKENADNSVEIPIEAENNAGNAEKDEKLLKISENK